MKREIRRLAWQRASSTTNEVFDHKPDASDVLVAWNGANPDRCAPVRLLPLQSGDILPRQETTPLEVCILSSTSTMGSSLRSTISAALSSSLPTSEVALDTTSSSTQSKSASPSTLSPTTTIPFGTPILATSRPPTTSPPASITTNTTIKSSSKSKTYTGPSTVILPAPKRENATFFFAFQQYCRGTGPLSGVTCQNLFPVFELNTKDQVPTALPGVLDDIDFCGDLAPKFQSEYGENVLPVRFGPFNSKHSRKNCIIEIKNERDTGRMKCSGVDVWCDPASVPKKGLWFWESKCRKDEPVRHLRRCTAPL